MLEITNKTHDLVLQLISKVSSLSKETKVNSAINIVSVSILGASIIFGFAIPFIIKKYADHKEIDKYLTILDAKDLIDRGNVSDEIKFFSKKNIGVIKEVFDGDVDKIQFLQGKPGCGKTSEIYRKCFSRNSVVLKITPDIVTAVPYGLYINNGRDGAQPADQEANEGVIKARLNRVMNLARKMRDIEQQNNKREIVILFDEIDKTIRSFQDINLSKGVFCDFINENFGNDTADSSQPKQNIGIRLIGISNTEFRDIVHDIDTKQFDNIGRRVNVAQISHNDDKTLLCMLLEEISKQNANDPLYMDLKNSRIKAKDDFNHLSKGVFPKNSSEEEQNHWISYDEHINAVLLIAEEEIKLNPDCCRNMMSLIRQCLKTVDVDELQHAMFALDECNLYQSKKLSNDDKLNLCFSCIEYLLHTESIKNTKSLIAAMVNAYDIKSLDDLQDKLDTEIPSNIGGKLLRDQCRAICRQFNNKTTVRIKEILIEVDSFKNSINKPFTVMSSSSSDDVLGKRPKQ